MVNVVPEATPALPITSKTAKTTTTTLFVVGIFRSGTSLLYALLNQHPQIALMYECDVWNFPRAFSGLRFRHDWCERLEFYGNALSRHRLIAKDNSLGLENVETPHDLYRVFAETRNARVIGEKSPFYCNRLRQLAQNHPDASFILIWRDPVEIFGSVADTARSSRYFRRPGMLSRLIYFQEAMIYGAAELIRSGKRVHHITYNDLIDRTENTCRGICDFLDIDFDERMINLAGADLSAVFRAPQFEYLRLGKIGRRQAEHELDPRVVQKLRRFHSRWNRLRHELLDFQGNDASGPEPGTLERVYHRIVGRLVCGFDGAIRVGFEFLPLPWLRTYRQAKAWFIEENRLSDQRLPLRDEFRTHKATLLAGLLVLTLVAVVDYYTSIAISLMPFYIIPASIVTLVVNRRWGTFTAALSALVWACVQNLEGNPYVNLTRPGIWLWDAFMRFLVVEIVVLLLERIRIEIRTKNPLDADR